jgi:histidinol dehydrogenase
MNIKLIKFGNDDFYKLLKHSLAFNEDDNSEIQAVVNRIIKDIKNNGDSALLSYTKKFDHLESKSLSELELTKESLKEAYESLDRSSQAALNESAQRIRDYHQNQVQSSWDYVEEDGTRLGQKITAIDTVGLYVPGGKAAYPSSVLMNAIPAKVAGVKKNNYGCPNSKWRKKRFGFSSCSCSECGSGFYYWWSPSYCCPCFWYRDNSSS